jgi:hypothetical protein
MNIDIDKNKTIKFFEKTKNLKKKLQKEKLKEIKINIIKEEE